VFGKALVFAVERKSVIAGGAIMRVERKKTILLVEDEALIALSEKTSVEELGYSVIVEYTGENAVETFKKNSLIDLILMDINLGKGMSGTEAAGLILKIREIPIIFLTSLIEQEPVAKTEYITSYGYVDKNSGKSLLSASIKTAFKLFEAYQKICDDERKFRDLFNSTFQFTGLLSSEGIIIEINKTILDFAGLTLENVAGKSIWEAPWWAGNETVINKIKKAVKEAAGGRFVRFETDIHGSGNKRVITDFSIKPLFGDDGKVIKLVPEGRDITERKEAEQSLQLREAYLSAIIENQPGLLWLKDLDSRFLAVNTKFAVSCGLDNPGLLTGKTDFNIWPHELASKYVKDDIRVIKSGKPFIVEELISDKGEIKWFETFKAPIVDGDGKTIGTTGYSFDISERKRAEDEIKHQLLEKEVLLKEVHHRIKNNIASIESLLTLQSRSTTNTEVVSALQDSISRIKSMRVIYDKLLLTENYQEISVRNYLESLIDTIINVFTNNQPIKINKRIDDFNLNSKVLFPVGIIINELLTNAIKYAFVGKDDRYIGILLLKKENHITLKVQDNGTGLPDGFEFNKLEGFGLMLVKILSEQINGTFAIGKIKDENGTQCTLEFNI